MYVSHEARGSLAPCQHVEQSQKRRAPPLPCPSAPVLHFDSNYLPRTGIAGQDEGTSLKARPWWLARQWVPVAGGVWLLVQVALVGRAPADNRPLNGSPAQGIGGRCGGLWGSLQRRSTAVAPGRAPMTPPVLAPGRVFTITARLGNVRMDGLARAPGACLSAGSGRVLGT